MFIEDTPELMDRKVLTNAVFKDIMKRYDDKEYRRIHNLKTTCIFCKLKFFPWTEYYRCCDSCYTKQLTAVKSSTLDQRVYDALVAIRRYNDVNIVYFIASFETTSIKIGHTSNLDVKLKNLQYEYSNPSLRPVLLVNGSRRLETELHTIFDEYRMRGEWFLNSGAIRSFIQFMLRKPNEMRKFMAYHSATGEAFPKIR